MANQGCGNESAHAATLDLQTGDRLKEQRSIQIFSVRGGPDIEVMRLNEPAEDGTPRCRVKLLGWDVFDPITMLPNQAAGDDVPRWMLDTTYDGMVAHADPMLFAKIWAWLARFRGAGEEGFNANERK